MSERTFTFPLHRDLGDGLVLTHTRPEHAEALEALQQIVFPELDPSERFLAHEYRNHVRVFPEGQMVVVHRGDAEGEERVVGMTTTMREDFDFDDCEHRFADLIEGGTLAMHDPQGAWLYGLDIGTHPDFRRRGIARALYRARQDLARFLGLRGQVTVGMMNGYGAVRDEMTARTYFDRLKRRELYDPTVSTQCKLGFEPQQLIPNYLSDPTCDDYGVLIVLDADKEI